MYAGTCAAWTNQDGCDLREDVLLPNAESHLPGMAYARNYATGTIETEGIKAYAMRARAARAGRIYAINEDPFRPLQTTGERAHGMSVAGYAVMRPETVLPPDTTGLYLLYAANTGTILTRSKEANGIVTQHFRGGTVIVENSGTIEVRGDQGVGILAASHGAESSVENCTLTYAG